MRDHRGLLSRAEGCWTFDARDRMPRSSRLTLHALTDAAENAPTATRTPPARAGSFVGAFVTSGHASAIGWILSPKRSFHEYRTANLRCLEPDLRASRQPRRCRIVAPADRLFLKKVRNSKFVLFLDTASQLDPLFRS